MGENTLVTFAVPDIAAVKAALVGEVMRSRWITASPRVKEFEGAFRDFLGTDVETVAVNSATAGLHLALEALQIGPGDDVIVPVHPFTATVAVVSHVGARPIFADVRADTLTLDVAHVQEVLTKTARVIIPVHFGGLASNMPELAALAAEHDPYIVEDAAQWSRPADGAL